MLTLRQMKAGGALALLGGGVLGLTGAVAATIALPGLGTLQPGLWQVKDLDRPNQPPQMICISDPAQLLQLRHRGLACVARVVATHREGGTVHYVCPNGAGYGQTAIRVETPRLAQIDAQGIERNVPFAINGQARRTGACR